MSQLLHSPEAPANRVLQVRRAARLARWRLLACVVCVIGVWTLAAGMIGVDPASMAAFPRRLAATFGDMIPPEFAQSYAAGFSAWSTALHRLPGALGETLALAALATLLGAIPAIPLAFLAAGNVTPHPAAAFAVRRAAELLRLIPEILFALMFVAVLGVGPAAGVLAVFLHTLGALIKQFAERIENADTGPGDALQAAGIDRRVALLYGMWPLLKPDFLSLLLLRFEINVRASSAVGIVGAGGLGQELKTAIDQFYPVDVGAGLLLIAATVLSVSMLTRFLCRRLRTHENPPHSPMPRRVHQRMIGGSLLLAAGTALAVGVLLHRLGVVAALADAGFGRFAIFLRFPVSAEPWSVYLRALGDTVAMAFVGTAAAALIAWPAALAAARVPSLRALLMRIFDLFRSVDVMVWALLCVGITGPGAFAGALAIAASEIGILGRLFTDAADNVSEGIADGVAATGAGRLSILRYAVIPQAMPDWITCFLFQIEGNIRSAAVLGIAGAGGIGFYLTESVRLNRFDETSAVLLPVAAAVFAVDRLSALLRRRVREAPAAVYI